MRKVIILLFLQSILPLNIFSQDYPIHPVPFTAVHLTDQFWAPRIQLNHDVTIPIALNQCYSTGRVDNFLVAGHQKSGVFCTQFPFDDTDIYKIIEGASYSLQTAPDPVLEAKVDILIAIIAKAQEPDGYLYTTRTIDPQHPHPWASLKRWEGDPTGSHELYNCGHLYEAAVAHYLATGKKTFLNIATKNADLLCKDFGPGKLSYYPGHEIVEMGLVKLYRATGKKEYLDLAKYFLDIRGGGEEYNQAHKKVIEQREAVGHAVRATYLYCGMADIAALTGNTDYLTAIDAIWNDVVSRKIYLTGGIGAVPDIEGFGPAYYLPNGTAYCETCAAIGNVYWNYRLFLLHGEAKYMDVLEQTLYNGVLSGISLSGDHFFYPNPLESTGGYERSEWFGCACCPSNICRFIPSIPGYMLAATDHRIYVNLYGQNKAQVKLADGLVNLTENTQYPWEGKILLTLDPSSSGTFELALRIPGWEGKNPMPGELYRFEDQKEEVFSILLNGKKQSYTMEKGYAVIKNKWKKGDQVELDLPMPVRSVKADSRVQADLHRIALQRGPMVYCTEWPDVDGGTVMNLVIKPNESKPDGFKNGLLGGIVSIVNQGNAFAYDESGTCSSTPVAFHSIPYYAWANRGAGEMEVWLPDTPSVAHILKPTPAQHATITASHVTKALSAMNDQFEPSRSNDQSIPHYHWWPMKDTTQWVQYTFSKPEKLSSSSVYWFDDGPNGGCRLPASWKLMVQDLQGKWQDVSTTMDYPIAKDQNCTVQFAPVITTAIRMEVRLSKENAAGILEWSVQ